MNQGELIDRIATLTGRTRADVREFYQALREVVGQSLADGSDVSLTNFGTFHARSSTRAWRNPRTGEPIETPEAYLSVRFRPSPALVEYVRGGGQRQTLVKRRPPRGDTG